MQEQAPALTAGMYERIKKSLHWACVFIIIYECFCAHIYICHTADSRGALAMSGVEGEMLQWKYY